MQKENTSWPLYKSESTVIGNLKSQNIILTLWTDTKKFKRKVDKKNYATINNYYTPNSINYLIRNIYANPNIRYIFLCGTDLAHSAKELLAFFENGVDSENVIIGTNTKIDTEIKKSFLDTFRNSVELVDCRSMFDYNKLNGLLTSRENKGVFSEPVLFKEPTFEEPDTFPSSGSGFLIREDHVGPAWLRAVNLVMRFGKLKKSHHSNFQKEILNLTIEIRGEDPDRIKMYPYFRFTKKEVIQYYQQILSPRKPRGIKYTYGSLFSNFNGVKQLDIMVEHLRKYSYSRRAVLSCWNPPKDLNNPHSPCLISAQFNIQNEKLFLSVLFRSNDIYRALPQNCFGLLKFQNEVASRLGIPVGTFTISTVSAHIYQENFRGARMVVNNNLMGTVTRWVMDPRGYFVIKVIDNKILVDHYANSHVLIKKYEGHNSKSISNQLIRDSCISLPSHFLYMGVELSKAETALKNKVKYVQDEPLKL